MVGPDVSEDEGPDPDEHVDEHFHRRGHRKHPSRLVVDAFRRGPGLNQRLRDPARRDRRAVCLDREPHPGRCNQRLVRHEGLRDRRQNQHLDDGEDHHQRRHEHRNLRPGADRAAGRNRRRDAADRNSRSERRRPFATEAETLARDEVNDRPVDEVGLDDRRDSAQQKRRSEIELSGRGHGDEGAEDDDGDLDVELRAGSRSSAIPRTPERNWRSQARPGARR